MLQLADKKNVRPLEINEFIGPLSNQPSTYIEEYEKFKEFNDEVTGLKLRREKKNKPETEEAGKKDTKKKKWCRSKYNIEFKFSTDGRELLPFTRV